MDFYERIGTAYFQRQSRYYWMKAAIAVLNEAESTANHAERLEFAKRIMNGNVPHYDLSLGIATNSTIKSKMENLDENGDLVEDYESDMDFVVSSVYDSFALSI